MTLTATSIKLPKSLKTRIARLAKRAGETPHAFMLRLLAEQVEATERFERFLSDAKDADKRMEASGVGFDAAQVHDYLEARVAGRSVQRPKPVQWRK